MRYIYDKELGLVEVSRETPKVGLTIIPDEAEFISENAFPETVKWTGRRSKKQIMKKYGCVDARDTRGLEKNDPKRQAKIERARQDPNVIMNQDIIKERSIEGRKETRKKYFFIGR